MESEELYNIGKFLIMILIIVALGMFIFNQTFSWYYKAELVTKPCDLCLKLNPENSLCPKINEKIINWNMKIEP
jgi:hypothetical protein